MYTPLLENDLNMYSVMFCVLSCLTRLVSDRNLVLVGLVALNLALAWNTATIPHFAEGNLNIYTTTVPHFAEGNLYIYNATIPHFADCNLNIHTTTIPHFAEGNLYIYKHTIPHFEEGNLYIYTTTIPPLQRVTFTFILPQ